MPKRNWLTQRAEGDMMPLWQRACVYRGRHRRLLGLISGFQQNGGKLLSSQSMAIYGTVPLDGGWQWIMAMWNACCHGHLKNALVPGIPAFTCAEPTDDHATKPAKRQVLNMDAQLGGSHGGSPGGCHRYTMGGAGTVIFDSLTGIFQSAPMDVIQVNSSWSRWC